MPDNTGNTFPWDINTDLPSNTNSEFESIKTDQTFRQMSAFNDSPFLSANGCDTPHEDNFIADTYVMTDKLIAFLKSNGDGSKLFDAQEYNKYGRSQMPLPSSTIPLVDEHVAAKRPFSVELNQRVCYLSTTAYIRILVDAEEEDIDFQLSYVYDDAEALIQQRKYDNKAHFLIDRKYRGVIFSVKNAEEYLNLYARIYDKGDAESLKMDIIRKFTAAYSQIKEPIKLRWFYENAPDFVIATFPKETLWKDLKTLYAFDDPSNWFNINFTDASSAILRLIRGMGQSDLFDYLNKEPQLILDIYRIMDGESMAEVEDVEDSCKPSPEATGNKHSEIMGHKRQFCALMLGLCGANSGKLQKADPTIVFRINKQFWVESNILFGDKPGQLFLQSMKRVEERDALSKMDNKKKTVSRPVNDGYFFHPFTLVNLEMECAGGGTQSVVVPAIFLKNLAAEAEWEQVWRDIRFGINLFIICFALLSFNPASLLAVVLSTTELLLAMGDLGVMEAEAELRQTPEGRKFLEEWNTFYNTGMTMTGLVQLFRLGATLLTSNFVRSVLVSTIIRYNVIRFGKGSTLKIVGLMEEFSTRVAANHINGLIQLEQLKVIVVKEISEGKPLIYHAIYEGTTIFSSESPVFLGQLRKICRLRGGRLVATLDEMLEYVLLRDFLDDIGDVVAKNLWTHMDGVVKIKTLSIGSGQTKETLDVIGLHTYEPIKSGQARFKKQTIPESPADDEPFIGLVQMRNPKIPQNWINKNNSTLRINNRQNRMATTIFPKNWPPMRVKMEVAHAYKNRVFIRKELKDGVVVEIFRGKCSVDFKIEFIYNDGVLVSTPPKVEF